MLYFSSQKEYIPMNIENLLKSPLGEKIVKVIKIYIINLCFWTSCFLYKL